MVGMNLRLLQLGDSALPIGGYTHSWGLEAALFRRVVHDAASLETWTRSWLRHSLAPLEGVMVASACRVVPDARRLNGLLQAMLVVPSIRIASAEMGDQLLGLASTWEWSAAGVRTIVTERGWHHAVIFGLLGALAGASPAATLAAYFHQAALGMIGAGVRAIPVNHTHGQQILAYLHGDIEALAADTADREPETAGSGCPFYEILCDEQTRLYTRMFRS